MMQNGVYWLEEVLQNRICASPRDCEVLTIQFLNPTLTFASIYPVRSNEPITSSTVPATNKHTARMMAFFGNFGGGFWNCNRN